MKPKKEEKIEAVVKEEKVIEKKEPTIQINKPVEFNLTEVIIIVLIMKEIKIIKDFL